MKKYENECCGCAAPAYPCLGNSCPNRKVLHHYCDICGEDIEEGELYEDDGREMCGECLKERHRKEWNE